MLTGKIDVTKIDKNRLFKGKKGTYLDIVIIEKANQYGDGMIIQSVSEEERKSGKQGTIIGNIKRVSGGSSNQPPPPQGGGMPMSQDDLPF